MSSLLSLAGNAAPTGFYDFPLEQSLRFNDDDNAYLSRTPASAGNRKTWTFSCWVKRGKVSGTDAQILTAYTSASDTTNIIFQSGGAIQWYDYISGYRVHLVTNALYRDVGSWYHLLFQLDTSNATSGDRAKIYVNGERVTSFSTEVYPSLNADLKMNTAIEHRIGDTAQFAREFDGYMADVNFVDGSALEATSFGQFKSGIWTPRDTSGLTFGTNGFRLAFGDSAAIGDDTSGNTNDWTANSLAATDVVPDSPTNNFATLNSIEPATSTTFSEGNLKATATASTWNAQAGTFFVSSGKWYAEVYNVNGNGSSLRVGVGIAEESYNPVSYLGQYSNSWGWYDTGAVYNNASVSSNESTYTAGDILGIGLDLDTNTVSFYKNGTLDFSKSISAGNWAIATSTYVSSSSAIINFGQDSTFAGNKAAGGNADENGLGDFAYAPPSGFLSLCSANLPTGAIDTLADETPEDYFNTVLWTGDNTTGGRSVTGVGFSPDLVYAKCRSVAYSPLLYDSIRGTGATAELKTDGAEAEGGSSSSERGYLNSFDSDGFSSVVGTNGDNLYFNQLNQTYVAWNWKAGGSGVSNTDGSITSTVSVGATSQQNWFSIVKYTGSGGSDDYGHGLGIAPNMIITKDMTDPANWAVYVSDIGTGKYLQLNSTAGTVTNSAIYPSVSSTTIGVGVQGDGSITNTSGDNYISYCFANAEGLCRAGSYVGNGSADGPMIWTGHRPSFVMIKRTNSTGSWVIQDSTRNPYNDLDLYLLAESSNAEATLANIADYCSNGFKLRLGATSTNASGSSYIYLSIAEQPFKYANAR